MKQVIALDIGGTNTRLALVDEKYNILRVEIRPTVTGSKERFLSSVLSIIKDNVKDFSQFCAIAAGVPGRVSPDGYIAALPNIGIEDIPLAEYLHKETGLPVFVKNDAEVACIAEANVGPYANKESLYFVTISTGVGGALARNGNIYPSSSEPGHVLVEYKGELREFEHLASGNGVVNLAKSEGMEVSSAKEFFEAYAGGDAKAREVFPLWLNLLASWFKATQSAFQPDVFVLTGGAMKSKEVFLDKLREAAPECNIQECGCGQNAGLLGAAARGFNGVR